MPVRFKSRLVAKGYTCTQREGVDLAQLLAHQSSPRRPSAACSWLQRLAQGWVVEQPRRQLPTPHLYALVNADTATWTSPRAALISGPSPIPRRTSSRLRSGRGVLKVKKSIYGFKQAGRCWDGTINGFLFECAIANRQHWSHACSSATTPPYPFMMEGTFS